MKRPLAIAALALGLLTLPSAALAACPQTSVGDLEDEVQCLECGVPLELATESPQANRERALIGRLVESCRSKEEIKRVLVAELGPQVLTTPDDDGFDLAAWLVPAFALLLAGAAIAVTARRWRRGGGSRPPATPGDPSSGRLEADIDRYDL